MTPGHRGIDGIGLGQRAISQHRQEGVDFAIAQAATAARASSVTSRAERFPARTAAASRRARCIIPSFSADARHPEPVIFHRGGRGQHFAAVQAGSRLVGSQDVVDRERVRHGGQMGQIEGGHVGGMLQHRAQLGREQVDLFLAQRQTRQVGHMDHVVTTQLSGAASAL